MSISRSCKTVTLRPSPSRQTILPSVVHAQLTVSSDRTFLSRSLRRLVKFSSDNVLRSLEPAFRGEHRTTRFVTSKLDNDRPGLVLAGRPDVSLTKADHLNSLSQNKILNDYLYIRRSFEVLWLKLMPKKLPRALSCIILACMYHSPGTNSAAMRDHVINRVDSMVRKHPHCGVLLTGDFNQLNDKFKKKTIKFYRYAQLVKVPTRGQSTLDKIWTNMSPVYDTPITLSELGSSDHNMVLLRPTHVHSLVKGSTLVLTKAASREEIGEARTHGFGFCIPRKSLLRTLSRDKWQ